MSGTSTKGIVPNSNVSDVIFIKNGEGWGVEMLT